MKFASVILAGGASRRMGSPKALLPFGDETFADKLVGLFEPFCPQIVVVLGHNAQLIRDGMRRAATFVINTDPERGQLTSLQYGLQEVYSSEPMADYVFFTPVDYPSIRESSVASVREHAGPYPVVPEYNGRHGHPVLIPAALIPEFLALNETETARVVMHRHASRTRYVDVDDPGILLDVDDPEAYRAITQGIL